MIKAGIIGATGYVGGELARLLNYHPQAEVAVLASRSGDGGLYGAVARNFKHTDYVCCGDKIEEVAEKCDVVFLALPHGEAVKTVTESVLKKTKIIDLGADFRLKDVAVYEKWYQTEHTAKNLLDEAVYGLCEINRESVKNARIVANPGCYTTCSILSFYPLLKEGIIDAESIIIDAKSGVSGAGKSPDNLYCDTNENFKAYKIASHRHTPEIEEQLSYAADEEVVLTFTPHLVPMNRGILATGYARLKKNVDYTEVKGVYEKYYGKEYFVRLMDEGVFPETKWVRGSNFTDIGFALDERTNRIVVVGALDNIVKGAAGQAIQNMNILFGADEKTGLDYVPMSI